MTNVMKEIFKEVIRFHTINLQALIRNEKAQEMQANSNLKQNCDGKEEMCLPKLNLHKKKNGWCVSCRQSITV